MTMMSCCCWNSAGNMWNFSNKSNVSKRRTLMCTVTAAGLAVGVIIGVLVTISINRSTQRTLLNIRSSAAEKRIDNRYDSESTNRINRTVVSFVKKLSEPVVSSFEPVVLNVEDYDENVDYFNNESTDSVPVQGIYWSSSVEAIRPNSFTDSDATRWRRICKSAKVIKIEEGCGRMQNRLLTFDDGTKACCRYRQNIDQIQGEIYSFYLSRLLDMGNVSPSTLALVQPLEPKWSQVHSELSLAQWAEDRPVVLTQYVQKLSPAYIPTPFRGPQRHLHPNDVILRNTSKSERVDLLQWSDLIVFDYLTANLDRIVNNLYNLQWNPTMMDAPAHNLARDPNTGLLLFLDNESGLLHGYRLLEKYENYHRTMLDALCVFRRRTVIALKRLRKHGNIGQLLKREFETLDPGFRNFLPPLPERTTKILTQRIDRVNQQISKCESLYESRKRKR